MFMDDVIKGFHITCFRLFDSGIQKFKVEQRPDNHTTGA